MNDSIAYPFEPRSSSRWMAEMHKQLLRGKQVLLHGNVEDLHLLNGSVTLGKDEITTRRFLTWYFTQRKFPVVAHFDIVDGVVLASPEMRADLERARAASADRGRRSTEVRAQPSPETGQSQQVVRRTGLAPGPQRSLAQGGGPSAVSPAHAGAANPPAPSLQPLTNDLSTLTEPDRALPEIRRAVRQAEVGCAFIIHFSDKLLSDSQRQSEKELPRLILLKKLIQEAELIDRPPLVDQRNALIIVAGQLGGVPTWLYQDNPLLALIHATRPRREERAHALRSQISRFFGGDVLHKTAAEPVVQELADLTDGLMVHDLDAIRRTSRLHKISLGEVAPKKLVDLYKYGQQEDPWLALDEGKISTARERLTRRVIGQDASINALVDMLRSAKVGLSFAGGSKASRPKGVFFFVGPTGVEEEHALRKIGRAHV